MEDERTARVRASAQSGPELTERQRSVLRAVVEDYVLTAIPVGWVFGYGIASSLVRALESEVYRFPLDVSRQASSFAALGIIVAALLSGLIVRRRLDQLDLIGVLKVRE
jgi:putative ABC transport system permease protein